MLLEMLYHQAKKWTWVLDSSVRGCGVYGSDSKASVVADSVSLASYLSSNGVVVPTGGVTAASVATVDAKLVVRR